MLASLGLCQASMMEVLQTLEHGAKYVQVNNKDTRTTPVALFWCLYCC